MSLRSRVGGALRALGLHRVTVAFVEAERKRAAARFPETWRARVLAAIDDDARPSLVAGAADPHAIAVIMCLWNRPDRIARILDLLEGQELDRPLRLIIWNNRPENGPVYREEIARRGAVGALASIEYHDSDFNYGGMARFMVAHKLTRDGYTGPFITFDDDQDVSPSFMADLLAAAQPLSCAGWWAWTYDDNYWEREPARPGEDATYVGTPGAVFDSALLADRAFFEDIPARYGFLEDMWSSYWVTSHGGTLRKVESESEFVELELNQYHALIDLKVEFGRYLKALPTRR